MKIWDIIVQPTTSNRIAISLLGLATALVLGQSINDLLKQRRRDSDSAAKRGPITPDDHSGMPRRATFREIEAIRAAYAAHQLKERP